MSTLRGLVYRAAVQPTRTPAWLVVSIDEWNERLNSFVAVPLWAPRPVATPLAPRIVAGGATFDAVVGRLSILFSEDLAGAQARLGRSDLTAVEDALRSVLELPTLFAAQPSRPRPPAGAIDYPIWGERYYAGPRIGGEFKRFVCVSANAWNRADGSALFVRTTSRPKRSTLWFPLIEGGRAQAACGDISFFPQGAVHFRDRPPTPLVSLMDMVAIARGLAAVLGL